MYAIATRVFPVGLVNNAMYVSRASNARPMLSGRVHKSTKTKRPIIFKRLAVTRILYKYCLARQKFLPESEVWRGRIGDGSGWPPKSDSLNSNNNKKRSPTKQSRYMFGVPITTFAVFFSNQLAWLVIIAH